MGELGIDQSGAERCVLRTYLDLAVHSRLLAVILLVVVRIHSDVVERKLLLYAVLEHLPLLQSQAITLGNDRHHVHRLAQLLQHHNVNRLQGMAGRADEVETAVDARVLNVPLTLRGQLLAQVGAVLVLDVLDDGVPAAVIVDQVAVAGGVDDVQAETYAVLLNDVGDGVDLGSAADGLVGGEAALGVDEVGGEDGVDQGGLAETGLACRLSALVGLGLGGRDGHGCVSHALRMDRSSEECHTDADDVELKATLQQLLLDLVGDAVEADVALGEDGGTLRAHGRGSHCSLLCLLQMKVRGIGVGGEAVEVKE